MLVVVGVDSRIDLSAIGRSRLIRCHSVCGENASQLDLKLDHTILVHDPVDAVLVVSGSEDLTDNQLAGTSGSG